jgi:hypothetical protein
MNNFSNIKDTIVEISVLLPVNIQNHIIELLNEDEFNIAFEELCCYLFEYDKQVTNNCYESIVNIGNYLRVDNSYWEPLLALVIKPQTT